jgi:hypothetical protein
MFCNDHDIIDHNATFLILVVVIAVHRALALKKAGIFQALRDEIQIKEWYDEQTTAFQLEGHADGIVRAKCRLHKLVEGDVTTIRIYSKHDICGRLIGRHSAQFTR